MRRRVRQRGRGAADACCGCVVRHCVWVLRVQHGWESTEECRRRQAGEGLRCMRLPDHYEVVDAELAGMLMVLSC